MIYETGLECDTDYHQRGRGCGWMQCSICSEEYWMGRIEGSKDFHFWPDGVYAYYGHCQSDAHDKAVRRRHLHMDMLLLVMKDRWEALKAENKLYQRPEMIAIRRLLR